MAKSILTQRQENFAVDVFKGLSFHDAYVKNYNTHALPATIDRMAFDLVHNHKISTRLDELRAEVASKAVMDRREILETHTEIARGRLGDFLDTNGELIEIDSDSLKGAALQELKTTHFTGGKNGRASEKTTTIKLHDPVKSMQEIAKLQGYYPKEEHGGNTYNDIKVLIVREKPKGIEDATK